MKKVAVLVVLVLAAVWFSRSLIARLFPITHEGRLTRISKFHKGGIVSKAENTRQLTQFALIFEDGFICEGTDTSFAAVEKGDTVKIRAYHDVYGLPLINPEFWECDEAQLVQLVEEHDNPEN